MGKRHRSAFESGSFAGDMGFGRVSTVSGGVAADGSEFLRSASSLRAGGAAVAASGRVRAGMIYRDRAYAASSVLDGVAFLPPDMDFLFGTDDQIAASSSQTASVAGDAGIGRYLSKFEPSWSKAGFATRKTYEVWRDALNRRQTGGGSREAAAPSPMEAPQRGLGGNVSPRVVGSQLARMNTGKFTSLDPLGDFNGVASVTSPAARTAPVDDDCVERPTGDTHGPGRWRGQWFNWCRD